MDLLKTKVYLNKINREYTRMSKDPENIMRLDIDIMLSYVRELYDALHSDEDESVSTPPKAAKSAPAPKAEQPAPPSPPQPKPPAKSQDAEKAPPPEEKPAPAPPPPTVVMENSQAEVPLPSVKPKAPAAPPSFPAVSPNAEKLFEHKEAKELSEKLSNMPIPDLRKAISLNDRMLYTRELFSDDSPAFEKAIDTLNGFNEMDQAKDYLLQHCVMRHRWTDKKRLELAQKFIKLVRRRFS